jgi:hypothetical protein
MSPDPLELAAPDDTGSITFARYHYQALVAVPFCIDCACRGKVLSVVAEHIEDIAVETGSGWRFIQVKTRDPELGPWRLAYLLQKGGALHSLARSHRILKDTECTLEVHLEGAVAHDDDLRALYDDTSLGFEKCRQRLREGLPMSEEDLDTFLPRLRIHPNLPSRHNIAQANIGYLADIAPSDLGYAQLKTIHDRLVDTISHAMTGPHTREYYPQSIVDPASCPSAIRTHVDAKRLRPETLAPLLHPLTLQPRPLLSRIVDRDSSTPTALEQKLIAGGAPQEIVDDAKSLRANAAIRKIEILAAGTMESQLDSLDESLRIRANAAVASHANSPQPAANIWNALLDSLTRHAATLDPQRVFGQVPELLLGEICELSDRCLVDWGKARV